ncbi:hypothetical protein M569_02652 [Genlisea aurea]|uniref:Pentatricopeptide repeat-containing protein n=1 Tax=Genlisea aurea TaxID=192259 RepID=S8CYN5_9LAMI|nr:hypothetical protein M569_02652 [Genlisea aurea]
MFTLSCVFPAGFVLRDRSDSSRRRNNNCCKDDRRSFPPLKKPSHPLLVNASSGVCEFFHSAGDLDVKLGQFIRSCSDVGDVRIVHCFLVKSAGDSLLFVNNNLTTAYAKHGDLDSARKVFDDMPDRNIVSWTALLNGYHKNDSYGEALSLLADFVKATGLRGNEQTYVSVLNLCSKTSNHDLGRQVHALVIKNGIRNLILDSTVLHFYAQCGDLVGAAQVFDEMEIRDVIAWTAMIAAFSQHDEGQEAFAVLLRMLENGLNPNEFTLCSLLDACGSEKELNLGKQLHSVVVKKGCTFDVFVATSLVDMYAKCSRMDESRTVFDAMAMRNDVTWNSMIAGYAKHGNGEAALELFRRMRSLKLPVGDLTMVSLLRACGSDPGLYNAGREVHTQILKGAAVDGLTGSELVWFYCQCRDYASASRVLNLLPDKTVASWTAMISGCCRLDHQREALEYLKRMVSEGAEPNPFTYSSALRACAELGNVHHGKAIHTSVSKTAAAAGNVFVGSALVHMYSRCGRLPEAARVFDAMPERNLVSWRSMIVAYAENGDCDGAVKMVYRMQAEGGFEVDEHILATVVNSCGEFIESRTNGFASLGAVF